jgi:ankyrin repeat protein
MIHVACIKGHLRVVKFMLKNNYFNKETKSSFNMTPLHFASQNGHIEIVRYLINIGGKK